MIDLTWEPIQRGLFHPRPWVRGLTVLGICLALGIPVGAIIGLLGGVYGSAALIALVTGYLMLRSITVGIMVLIGIIFLLPFAALPINIGFSPTFLDLALLAVFFVWVSRLVTRRAGEFIAASPTGFVLAFVMLAMVSFVAGLSHAPLTSNVLRHFAEILLSILLFLLVINNVRTRHQLRWIVIVLMVAGFATALIGIGLYILPTTLSTRLLSALQVVRYPAGDVLRFIEDNPELPQRAIATSVDPNVLGGTLIFVTTVTVAQMLCDRPLLPRRWLILMAFTMGICMVLTFSRGSFVGLGFALFLLAALKYRRIFWIGLIFLAIMMLLPPTQAYVDHFFRGVRVEDQATQMRLGEYQDSLTLISRYPWFGVGFAGTPDIDTYLGVSSVYLLIAEEMGLVGLSAFLGAILAFFVRFARSRRALQADPELEPIYLGTSLAVAGAMIGGIFDHYLFNLKFPHSSSLLWLVVGLAVTSTLLAGRSKRDRPATGEQA
ncbi:MAG: O-antigen ligase family protein [Anaerolineae bacterium]